MVNTKLIKLLSSFSKSETIKFHEFVNSPYFNKNKNVIMLCKAVMGYYPDFENKDLTEENVFRKMFGKEKFDYYKIKNIISDLYQVAILFLKTRTVEKREYENEINLLNELHERKQDLIYDQREKKVSGYLNNLLVKDERYYFMRHQLGKINTSHYKFERSAYTFHQIQNEFDTFIDYTLIGLLRLYSKMLHNKNHGNINFNMVMFDTVWEYVKEKEFPDSPSSQIYKQIILLELHREEKDYRKLLELKDKFSKNIPREDLYYILLIINSYSVYRLRSGDESYYNDRFYALKSISEENFIPQEDILYVNFITTFTSACMTNEYEWAENFLNKYNKGINPPEERKNTVNFCKGFLSYRMREYDKALEYFALTNFKFYIIKIMVKSYTIRIYYEQGFYEQVISAIDSFKHYLKSERLIDEEQKTAHYDFLKHLNDLTMLKIEGVKSNYNVNLSFIRKQIREMKSNPLAAKNWLIEKSEKFVL